MRVIIAGSRDGVMARDIQFGMTQFMEIHGYGSITEVVCGMARGADRLGKVWAGQHGIPVKPFPADWKKYRKAAGFRRNEEMAEYADGLVAIWVRGSPGTGDMIERAEEHKLRIVVVEKRHGLDEGYMKKD